MTSFVATVKPSSFGSWPARMITAIPFMYPTRIGPDRRSVRNPSRAMAAARHRTPAMIVMAEARSMARMESPAANGTTAAANSGSRAESGPKTRMRDGPTRKYPMRAPIEAYRPAIAGRPAACA